MRTVKAIRDHGKNSTVSLEVAIRNLRSTDEVSGFKETLQELKDEWFASESASDRHIRARVVMHTSAMMVLLDSIEGKEVVS